MNCILETNTLSFIFPTLETIDCHCVTKQTLLFVSQEIPSSADTGTQMRAGNHIRVLAEKFEIILAILGGAAQGHSPTIDPEIKKLCSSIIVANRRPMIARLMRGVPTTQLRILLQAVWPVPLYFARCSGALTALAEQLAGQSFDRIHCFRLSTAPLLPLLKQHRVQFTCSVLDLDAYESQMAFRTVKPDRALRGRQMAAIRWLDGAKWAVIERLFIPQFDCVYVSAEFDRLRLARRFPKNRWYHIPNTVVKPEILGPVGHDRFTFLFVGLLNYVPNTDAVVFFCRQVLPLLRQRAPGLFRVFVVGRYPDPAVVRLREIDEVEVVANPRDLAPYYARTDVAIVPLRAGGGTRVKILEAFSYKVPVVSTTLGAEGLDVTPGSDILIADNAEDFAKQCHKLWVDSTLRNHVAEAGHDLWQGKYSPSVLEETLMAAYEAGMPSGVARFP